MQKREEEVQQEISELSKIVAESNIEADDKKRVIAYIREEEFQGPLPHPRILKEYDEIVPGFAQQIIDMTQCEQRHRHEMEERLVESEVSINICQINVIEMSIKLKSRLQFFGFIMTILLIAICAGCIYLDKSLGGIATFVFALASFCATIFYGRKNAENDEKENDEGDE